MSFRLPRWPHEKYRPQQTSVLAEWLGLELAYYPQYINRKLQLHSVYMIRKVRRVLISFLLSGDCVHHLGEDLYEERGGSLGITHYEQVHDLVTTPEGIEVMNIFLDLEKYPLPRLPAPLQAVLPQLLPLHPNFQHRLNRMIRLQFDDFEPVARTVLAMHAELDRRPSGFEQSVTRYFELFLMYCCRQFLASGMLLSVKTTSSPEPYLERLRQRLDREYAQTFTLSELAEEAGISSHYLCRAFKRYTGKRIFDYLLDRRLQTAMLLLRDSDEKILSIAMQCGFKDLGFFNRKFKLRLGCTPGEYRARLRNEA